MGFRLILRIVGGRGAPAETLTDALKIHGLDGGSGGLAEEEQVERIHILQAPHDYCITPIAGGRNLCKTDTFKRKTLNLKFEALKLKLKTLNLKLRTPIILTP